jgi:hypothetical protein
LLPRLTRDLPVDSCEVTCHRRDGADILIQYFSSVKPCTKVPSQPRPTRGHSNCNRSATAIPCGRRSKNVFQVLLGLARPASQVKRGAHLLMGETEFYRVANTMSDLLDPFRRICALPYSPRKS